MGVEGAAAADDQPAQARPHGAARSALQRARELGQGRLHVCGLGARASAVEVPLQPGRIEQVAAGALGRRLGEIGFGQQRLEQRSDDLAARRPSAPSASKGWPVCRGHQSSISALPGPQSKPSIAAVRAQQRQIGDAADVQHHHGLARLARTAPGGRTAPAARPGRRRRRRGCGSRRRRRCRVSSASSAGC